MARACQAGKRNGVSELIFAGLTWVGRKGLMA